MTKKSSAEVSLISANLLRIINALKSVMGMDDIRFVLNTFSSGVAMTRIEPGKVTHIYYNPDHPIFNTPNPTLNSKTLVGVIVHEMLHKLYTDPEYERLALDRGKIKYPHLFHDINNILEDFVIESLCILALEIDPRISSLLRKGTGIDLIKLNPVRCLESAILTGWKLSPPINEGDEPVDQIISAMVQFTDMGPLVPGSVLREDLKEDLSNIYSELIQAVFEEPAKRIERSFAIYSIIEKYCSSDQPDKGDGTKGRNSSARKSLTKDELDRLMKDPRMKSKMKLLKKIQKSLSSKASDESEESSKEGKASASKKGKKDESGNPDAKPSESDSKASSAEGDGKDGSSEKDEPKSSSETPEKNGASDKDNKDGESDKDGHPSEKDSASDKKESSYSEDDASSSTDTSSPEKEDAGSENEGDDSSSDTPEGSDSKSDEKSEGSEKSDKGDSKSDDKSDSSEGDKPDLKEDDTEDDGESNEDDSESDSTHDNEGDDSESLDNKDVESDLSNDTSEDNGESEENSETDGDTDDGEGSDSDRDNDEAMDSEEDESVEFADEGEGDEHDPNEEEFPGAITEEDSAPEKDSDEETKDDEDPFVCDDEDLKTIKDTEETISRETLQVMEAVESEPIDFSKRQSAEKMTIDRNTPPAYAKEIECRNYVVTGVSESTMTAYDKVIDRNRVFVSRFANKLKKLSREDEKRDEAMSGRFNVTRYSKKRNTTLRIFDKVSQQERTNARVVIALDVSGSMEWGDKIGKAKEALACIVEGLTKAGIPVKVMTFHNSYEGRGAYVEHHHYVNYKDNKAARSSIMMIRAGGDNFDGYSIRYAMKELLRQKSRNHLLIVISDGQPATLMCTNPVQDAINAIIEVKRRTKVIGIGIDANMDVLKSMYKDTFVELDSIENMMSMLGKIFVKEVRSWQ